MDKATIADFQKLDIRVGTVVKAEVPEWSHWVIKLTVDFGEEIGTKTVFAGMMKFYKPEEFEGKQFPFVVNMEAKKIGSEGDFSEGMMLAALISTDVPDEEKPVLFNLSEKVPNGSRVR